VDPSGFVVKEASGREFAVRWIDVVAVLAYKQDLYIVDEVVMAFRQRQDPELVLEVSEDWPGFSDLFAPLERELGISDAWYLETTGKPFATDFRVLYDRRPSAPSS
jgi:hypothetical protein